MGEIKTCKDCEKKNVCTELCPDVEAYVSQDEVKRRERLISEFPESFQTSSWPTILQTGKSKSRALAAYQVLTPIEKRILTLLVIGLGRSEICKELDIAKEVYKVHLCNLRKKVKNLNF